MAFDLSVFNKQVYAAVTETVDQHVDLFNEASGGAITLTPSLDNSGDYSVVASFKRIGGLVRRRNVYNGADDVTPARLTQHENRSVKIAAGTPPIEFEQAQYDWLCQNPASAALIIGEQLAKALMADIINTAVAGAKAALSGVSALTHTTSSALTFGDLVKGAGKFGDRQGDLVAWVAHSKAMTDLYSSAVANAERLFVYGSVQVVRDPFGRVLIMTDSDALFDSGSNQYYTIGLAAGGIMVEQNGDFRANLQSVNGKENIQNSYQAEWSYNLGLRGFSWNTASGGAAPSNAAVATTANWTKTASGDKDTAGVLVVSK